MAAPLDLPQEKTAEPLRRAEQSTTGDIFFSLTINVASRRAYLPPRISFIIRNAITRFASIANIIKLNISRPNIFVRTMKL